MVSFWILWCFLWPLMVCCCWCRCRFFLLFLLLSYSVFCLGGWICELSVHSKWWIRKSNTQKPKPYSNTHTHNRSTHTQTQALSHTWSAYVCVHIRTSCSTTINMKMKYRRFYTSHKYYNQHSSKYKHTNTRMRARTLNIYCEKKLSVWIKLLQKKNLDRIIASFVTNFHSLPAQQSFRMTSKMYDSGLMIYSREKCWRKASIEPRFIWIAQIFFPLPESFHCFPPAFWSSINGWERQVLFCHSTSLHDTG